MNPNQLENEIHLYNQQLSQLESTSCENMLDAIDHLVEYLSENPAISKPWLDVFKASALAHIKNMLQADSAEEFKHYQQGFNEVIATLDKQTAVNDLAVLRINNCLTTLQQMAAAITTDIVHLDEDKKRRILEEWAVKWTRLIEKITGPERAALMELETELLDVFNAQTEADFFNRKQTLEHRILVNPYYMHLHDTHLKMLTHLCQTNLQAFAETRLDYLKQVTSKATMLQDALWITAGVGLTVAGLAVTSGAAAVVLGAAGAGYGVIDFAKESREKVLNHGLPKIGKQNKQYYSARTQNLLHTTEKPASRYSLSEKAREKLGFSLTTLGAVIAVAGLASAIFPPAAPFIMGAVALGATVAGVALYAHKVWRQRKRLKIAAKQCEAIQQGLRQTQKTHDSTLEVEKAIMGLQTRENLTEDEKKHLEANLLALEKAALADQPQQKKQQNAALDQVAAAKAAKVLQENNNNILSEAISKKDTSEEDEQLTPPL